VTAAGRTARRALPTLLALPLLAQAPTQFVARTAPALQTRTFRDAAIGDFDSDGDLDVCGAVGLLVPIGGPTRLLLRNDGQESFTDVSATALPGSGGTTLGVVALDADADGDLDLFLGMQNVAPLLLQNGGAGTFVAAPASVPASGADHEWLAVADLDGDGDPDVAAARGDGVAGGDRVFVNNGAGTFLAVPLNTPVDTQGLVGADFDGDGDTDLVAGATSGPRFLRNDGAFVFTDVTATWFSAPAVRVIALAAGDLDGDGDVDLVCGRLSPTDLVLRNTGSAFVVSGTLANLGVGACNSVALFDCDEDGDLDVARTSVTLAQPIQLALNDGGGGMTPAPWRLPPTACSLSRVFAADLDRDGDSDLFVTQGLGGPTLTNTMLVNRHRDLQVAAAVVGQPWAITATSEPGYATLHHTCRLGIGLAQLPVPVTLPGLGVLWLDLGASHVVLEDVVLAPLGTTAFTLVVPPLPQLVGIELHAQAVLEQSPGPARLTAAASAVIQ
jgi:hypothetical protein